MSQPVAFIFGIAGQDGSYLAESLEEQGFKVVGMLRRNSVSENQDSRLAGISGRIITEYGDVTDSPTVDRLLEKYQPDEIYNLAAQSHVQVSFQVPSYTVQTNGIGLLNVLESMKHRVPNARLYQASSSEMFGTGVDGDGFQRETTVMNPVSPYGAAKLFAFNISRIYRDAYELFISNGILFNHESPRRGSNFLTSKVVKTACEISLGQSDRLVLGNLDSQRDWGHSKDYVAAMQKILRHDKADDFVVASGQTLTVGDFVSKVFDALDLDAEKHVFQDEAFMRPNELPYLKGDSSKARRELGWKPNYDVDALVEDMISHWLAKLSR